LLSLSLSLSLFIHRFSSEDISGQNQVKASVQRRIRQSIAEEVHVEKIRIPLNFSFVSVSDSGLVSLPFRYTEIKLIAVPSPRAFARGHASEEVTDDCG
jgi:hypothetical protein